MSIFELEALASSSRKKNFKLHITGLLIRKPHGFTQYLEGEKTTITLLYEAILRDKRHHSSVVVEKGFISERRFAKWSLLLKFVTNEEIIAIESSRYLTFDIQKKKSSATAKQDVLSQLLKKNRDYN